DHGPAGAGSRGCRPRPGSFRAGRRRRSRRLFRAERTESSLEPLVLMVDSIGELGGAVELAGLRALLELAAEFRELPCSQRRPVRLQCVRGSPELLGIL